MHTDPDHWLCSCWTPLLWHSDMQQHPNSAAKWSGATEPLHLCYRCRWSKVSSQVHSFEADILGLNSVSRCNVVVRLRQNVLSSLVSTKQNTLALLKPSQANFAPLEVKSVETKCRYRSDFLPEVVVCVGAVICVWRLQLSYFGQVTWNVILTCKSFTIEESKHKEKKDINLIYFNIL